MAAIANITLNDAAGTPVLHTFNPFAVGYTAPGVLTAIFEDRVVNSGIPVGFYKIDMSMSKPSAKRPTYRIGLKLSVPQLENVTNSTVSGIAPAPTVAYNPIYDLNVVIPERASGQVRLDQRKMFYELLNNTQVRALLEGLEPPF